MVTNPLIVAIDTSSRDDAIALARRVAPHVGAFKVGIGLLYRAGPGLIGELAAMGRPVFADAKLHDIPTQVGRAADALGRAGARWVTVHASGGTAMMRAAVEGLSAGSSGAAGVLAVTVLTSLDAASLRSVGIEADPAGIVGQMAAAARDASVEGVVCSPLEIGIVHEVAPQLTIVTPGIRPDGTGLGDQKRVATPQQALADGAHLLVIGRAITEAEDPALAAAAIADSVNA